MAHNAGNVGKRQSAATAKRPEARKRAEAASAGGEAVRPSAIGCQTRLGGLLRHYYRKAA